MSAETDDTRAGQWLAYLIVTPSSDLVLLLVAIGHRHEKGGDASWKRATSPPKESLRRVSERCDPKAVLSLEVLLCSSVGGRLYEGAATVRDRARVRPDWTRTAAQTSN